VEDFKYLGKTLTNQNSTQEELSVERLNTSAHVQLSIADLNAIHVLYQLAIHTIKTNNWTKLRFSIYSQFFVTLTCFDLSWLSSGSYL